MKPVDLPALLERIQTRYLRKALKASNHSRTHAAKLLGLNRTALVEKLRARKLIEEYPPMPRDEL